MISVRSLIKATFWMVVGLYGCAKTEEVPAPFVEDDIPNRPPSPFEVRIIEVGSTYAVIDWGPIFDPDGDIVYQDVVFGDSIVFSEIEEDKLVTFQNLTPERRYDGYVRATDNKSNPVVTEFTFVTKKYQTVFNRLHGGLFAYDMSQTSDGGFIIAGNLSFDYNGWGSFIMKTDSLGYEQWFSSVEGHENPAHLGKVFETLDGGFVLSNEVSIQKFDVNGNNVWVTERPGYTVSYNSLVQTDDGGYLVAGINGENGNTGIVVKFDESGNKDWEIAYDPNTLAGLTNCQHIIRSTDGNYVIVGGAGRPYSSTLATSKIDPSGKILWQKEYSFSNELLNAKIYPADDNSFIVSANTADSRSVFSARVLKIDQNGSKVWDKSFLIADHTEVNSVTRLKEGGFILAGSSRYRPAAGLIIKIDDEGNTVWQRSYYPSSSDYQWVFETVLETSNSTLTFMGGKSFLYSGTEYGLWLLRTDMEGSYQ